MKQAITEPLKSPLNTSPKSTPLPKPTKGDIESCKRYASAMADKSRYRGAVLASVWVRFLKWSFLTDQSPKKQHYTGWKKQTYTPASKAN